jgi:CheY-like chemotaxis protein
LIATNGQEALELLAEKSYDCIMVDYMLPDIRGMDFVVLRLMTVKKAG